MNATPSDLERKIIEVLEHGEPEERESMLRVFKHACGEKTAEIVAEVHEPKFMKAPDMD